MEGGLQAHIFMGGGFGRSAQKESLCTVGDMEEADGSERLEHSHTLGTRCWGCIADGDSRSA